MSSLIEIDLEWPVATQYVARAATAPAGDRAIYVAEGATFTVRRPLDDNPNLFAEFAELDGSEQSCLQFAHKYGTLLIDSRHNSLDSGTLESLTQWRGHIQTVRNVIDCCRLGRDHPAEAFRRFGKRDVLLHGGLSAYVSIITPKAPPTLTVRCEYFLAALELQAVQSILGGRDVVKCIECSKPFEVGVGARRSQSKFCSPRCKDSYHNRIKADAKRSRHA